MKSLIPLVLLLGGLAGCAKPAATPLVEVEAARVATLPADPADAAWNAAPAYTAALLAQDMVEPRLLVASTPSVNVQALTDGTSVAFRLVWADDTQDDLPGAGRFVDACAVQLPAGASANVPAPQMGESGGMVEISYWSAAWQAILDGRPDTLAAIEPRAAVDHYPFEAASLAEGSQAQKDMALRYAPARALAGASRPAAGKSVQDLRAEGPGTITPAAETKSAGKGVRDASGWQVVIVKPVPEGLRSQARSQVAFAIWDGSHNEVGPRKMRSVWIPLALGGGA